MNLNRRWKGHWPALKKAVAMIIIIFFLIGCSDDSDNDASKHSDDVVDPTGGEEEPKDQGDALEIFNDFTVTEGIYSVQISFASLEYMAVKIEYGMTGNYGNETSSGVENFDHAFTLTDLNPETVYHFRPVSSDLSVIGDDQQFTTLTAQIPQVTKNIYLDKVVEWQPTSVGRYQIGRGGLSDENGIPIQNDRALGPPTGNGSWSRVTNCTTVGINGSAAFRFEKGYCIYNGEGEDFITFEGSFAWNGWADGLCCELAHVEVSEDTVTWYYNSTEKYDINPDPTQSSGDYQYFNVEGLHGNNPTWANYQKDMQAQQIELVNSFYTWVDIEGVVVSKDFKPDDPYLGGNRFDLSTFLSKEDDTPWPDEGKMRYVRIIDDDTILDGQDYNKGWCLGAQMHAAMGINVRVDSSD